MTKLRPGQPVLVRAHHGIPRSHGTVLSINRDRSIVVRTAPGTAITVYQHKQIVQLVQR